MATRTIANGGGNWNTNGTWVENAVPTSSDDVVATATSGNLTIDDTATCKSINLTNYVGTLTHVAGKTLTVASYSGLNFVAGMTYVCNTGLIICSLAQTFNGASKTFYDVTLNGTNVTMSGSNIFTNLTRNGPASQHIYELKLYGNQTITGTLTLAGNSAINRIFICSDTDGSARILDIRGATFTPSYVDFQDIQFRTTSGNLDISTATGYSGDCGGNSMYGGGTLTFTASDTQTWNNADGGNWQTVGNWTGTAISRIPLPQDDCVMGIAYNTSKTITANMPRLGRSIDWTGATYTTNLTWSTSTSFPNIVYGSIDLTGLGTFDESSFNLFYMSGRGAYTLKSNGLSIRWLFICCPNGFVTLQDNITFTTSFGLVYGTFDAVTYNVTTPLFTNLNSGTCVLYMGDGTWTITGTNNGNVWIIRTANLTFYKENSTIVLSGVHASNTRTFSSDTTVPITYNNITITGGGAGRINFDDDNTFSTFTINSSNIPVVSVTAGKTVTVASLVADGDATHQINIKSDTPGTHAHMSDTTGTNAVTYCTITDMQAIGGATWNAFTSSGCVDGGGNSGWNWLSTSIKSVSGVAYASIKKISGVAIASVKKVGGLA